MTNDLTILSIAYLPPIQYFTKLLEYSVCHIEKYENYIKQTYRNRCMIYSANGIQTLSVPVAKGKLHKTLIKDVQISYDTNWQKNHLKSIESAYRSSPYYEFYIDEISPLYYSKHTFLFDFNLLIINIFLKLLEISTEIKFTTNYISLHKKNIKDFRLSIHPKNSFSLSDNEFKQTEYHQVFTDKFGFKTNLSIIDLLFNEGPNSLNILKQSIIPIII
ncbi:MAG: WbqC family protein [Bacteroidales bacterium]|nr:WbqC family protein [Bacteroidales bacterium]